MIRKLILFWVTAAGVKGATIAADSTRGEQLFATLACVQCHSINGKGGKLGPDLGRSIDRNFTPAILAATMWNHAPTMWSSMHERDIRAGDLNEQAAADLFAYFYATRFFEKPGDAGRGKHLFASKHCAECHGVAVFQKDAINSPIALVSAMWNHAATMREEFAKRKLAWPELTSQDLADILVYVRNLPAVQNVAVRFEIVSGTKGEALFQSKGCAACHSGKLALAARLKNKTLTDIAVAMWNHEPKMAAAPPRLNVEEMSDLANYLWAEPFFEDSGNAAAGRRVFAAKHCATCHENRSSGAPNLSGRSFTAATMVSSLWHHGPRMLDEMQAKGIAWPRFERSQMSDLIAFLNSAKGKTQ